VPGGGIRTLVYLQQSRLPGGSRNTEGQGCSQGHFSLCLVSCELSCGGRSVLGAPTLCKSLLVLVRVQDRRHGPAHSLKKMGASPCWGWGGTGSPE
jgi:hypothetical protein